MGGASGWCCCCVAERMVGVSICAGWRWGVTLARMKERNHGFTFDLKVFRKTEIIFNMPK